MSSSYIMKKHLYLFLLAMAMLPLSLYAQQSSVSSSSFNPDKIIYGGSLGFGFSRSFWSLNVSPQIGYKLTDKFHVGAGVGYSYAKRDSDYSVYTIVEGGGNEWLEEYKWVDVANNYKESSASFNLFANYYPWQKLILSLKPEIMHTWYRANLHNVKFSENKFVPIVIVGAGFHLKPFILQLNYELIQDEYSPYSDNVFLSVGVMF